MTKKLLAAILAAAAAMTVCTACGNKKGGNADGTSSAADAASGDAAGDASRNGSAENNAAETEEPTVAKSGDAILIITDGQWYAKYFGTAEDLLSYGAGAVQITGNGDYTVSVNAGSAGTQKEITGDPNGSYQCSGLGFAAVKVMDGTKLFPEMSIEIREIRVDGNPVQLSAKNYTSSDDNTEMRANIYNEYVSRFPDDAHNADGKLTGEFGEYSSQIVDPAAFSKWQKVEVDFTVSGIGAQE